MPWAASNTERANRTSNLRQQLRRLHKRYRGHPASTGSVREVGRPDPVEIPRRARDFSASVLSQGFVVEDAWARSRFCVALNFTILVINSYGTGVL